MDLRPYQAEALNGNDRYPGILKAWKENRRVLAVLPTASGKTIVFSHLSKQIVANGGRVLILAHREELIRQAADKMMKATGLACAIEKAEESSVDCLEMITVGSVQSLINPARREAIAPPTHIICDEAHHILSDSWQTVVNHWPNAYVLGVTATPDRGDMRELGMFFDSLAFEYTLPEGAQQGYLSKLKALTLPLKIDITGVKQQSGDYATSGLGKALEPYLPQIAKEIAEHCKERKCLVFAPLCITAQTIQKHIEAAGLPCFYCSGDDRSQIAAWEAHGPGCVMVNAMLMTEGYDHPPIDAVCVLRATRVRSLYCLDEETEILTTEGWKKDIRANEEIYGFNLATEHISAFPVTATVRRPVGVNEKWVSISSASLDIKVTGNHRMIFDEKKRTGWKIAQAEHIASLRNDVLIPCAGKTERLDVPLTDDELRFIGWVMTDGSINRLNNAITITQGKHQPWVKNIQECIDGCGFKYGKHEVERKSQFRSTSKAILWTISKGKPRGRDKHLRGWGALEPWISKDFHPNLMALSERQFSVLLEAIHLGDGSKQLGQYWTRRSYHIATGNRTFADRLQITATLNGWRCNIAIHHQNLNPLYMLHIKQRSWRHTGGTNMKDRPTWKVSPSNPSDNCWCVESDAGTIITRRNGKVAIMGNSQMIGRANRIHPGKEYALILDFLWMSEKHNLCRPASLIAQDDDIAEAMTEDFEANTGMEKELSDEEIAKASQKVVEDREAALAKKLAEMQHRKRALVDPLQYAMSIGDAALADYKPALTVDRNAPTPQQIEALGRAGIFPEEINSAGHAAALLEKLRERKAQGLAQPRQIRCLERYGVKKAGSLTYENAQKMIARIAANGWRMPHTMREVW